MITITENKVLIEFEHSCPQEAVKDLQRAIITSIQNQKIDEFSEWEEIMESNYVLLEMLRNTIEK